MTPGVRLLGEHPALSRPACEIWGINPVRFPLRDTLPIPSKSLDGASRHSRPFLHQCEHRVEGRAEGLMCCLNLRGSSCKLLCLLYFRYRQPNEVGHPIPLT